jgi:hypothetical protein
VSSAQTIADKTLHDATALLTAAFKGAPFNYPAATAGFFEILW